MLFGQFESSPAIRVLRYSDVDHFRQAYRLVQAEFIPLSVADFAPVQAILPLPGCDLYMVRTFPRILDASLSDGNALVLFSMEDSASVTFNGIDDDLPSLAFLRGKAGYKVVERVAKMSAAIGFASPMRERGWPTVEDGFQSCKLPVEVLRGLRTLVRSIFAAAAEARENWFLPGVAEGVRESLLASLDGAFMASEPTGIERSAAYRKHMQIVDTIDGIFNANPAAPIYSEALASGIGVSVRTLHNAIMRMRGVSLHQYLRMKRLWMVRQRLLTGDPCLQVKSCAIAYGFWHLGEFAAAYSALFGEVPSQTLARARGPSARPSLAFSS